MEFYRLLFSFLIPLFLLRKEKNIFDFLGIKALGKKQVFILVVFIAFSVGGQIIPIVAKGGIIPWNLLPMGIVPLIMTTFFEEFLFRGFFQNKFEKEFGTITAILVSGLMFCFTMWAIRDFVPLRIFFCCSPLESGLLLLISFLGTT